MKVEYHSFYSHHLGKDMPFKVYGHAGKPLLVFPSSGGRFYEYEDFLMVEACRDFIDRGKVRLYTVDSVDYESWLNEGAPQGDRARRHQAYDRYITDEFLPFLRSHANWQGRIGTTGCSMGGYHSANFFFRHPDLFDLVIALSGIYDARFFLKEDVRDLDVYYNSPVDYLRNLVDPLYLDAFRASDIIICTGQGAWEEDTIRDTRILEAILKDKEVPAWVDYWGHDVDHDWPWWQKQIKYFLAALEDQASL